MAHEIPAQLFSRPANADLSSSQFLFLAYDNVGAVGVSVTAGADTCGVLQNKPHLGQPAAICGGGVSKVVAGAAVTPGAEVTNDTSGRAVAATSGQYQHGKAITAAAAAGEIISVQLRPAGKQ